MIRNPKKYSIEEIISQSLPSETLKKDSTKIIDGDPIHMNSKRYECFKKHGTKCMDCGIEGKYFYKEHSIEQSDYWHFNLYAVDENGKEILMTKGHRDNRQTTCELCHNKKQSKLALRANKKKQMA